MKEDNRILYVLLWLVIATTTLSLSPSGHAHVQARSHQRQDYPHAWQVRSDSHEPVLVKDINTTTFGADPRDIVVVDNVAYLVVGNRELWRSDGTLPGTVLVKDFLVGGEFMGPSWAPQWVTVMNGALYFSAEDADHGRELWRSDGTEGGTTIVRDINPGASGSNPQQLVVMDAILYFTLYDAMTGPALWRSDGTDAGTWHVADLPSSPLGDITIGNGALFFVTHEYPPARLWVSDGTTIGTVALRAFDDYGDAQPAELTFVNGMLYFAAGDEGHGRELWRSDGTEAGTIMVKDIYPGQSQPGDPSSSHPNALASMDGLLYFAATDATTYNALWRSDGTEAGTTQVHNAQIYLHHFPAGTIVPMNSVLYYAAYGPAGQALWRSDGTAVGTEQLVDLFQNDPYELEYRHLTAVNDRLYFAAEGDGEGPELWRSDGTNVGTVLVKDILIGADGSAPGHLTAAGSGLFFSADDGLHGRELWHSDGTTPGTVMTRDINTTTHDADVYPLAARGETLFFVADDGIHGRELWRTNCLTDGTGLVKDVWPGAECSGVEHDCGRPIIVNANDFAYAALNDGTHGWELWRTDGTENGTWLVKDIFPGFQDSIRVETGPTSSMLTIGNTLYFSADDGVHGADLWRSDGTADGTQLVKDLVPGEFLAVPSAFVALDNILYFVANTNGYGSELWRSDGTEAGTTIVKDINPGGGALAGGDTPLIFDGILYFRADDGVHGYELWRSDGTDAGTYMVKDTDANVGGLGNSFSGFAALGQYLYFQVTNDAYLGELWRSDGTEAGTTRVKSFDNSLYHGALTVVDDLLFFTTVHDSTFGRELWRSDGSEVGTFMVKDIYLDGNSSDPQWLTAFNGLLYFTADDGSHGRELWRSDGTEAGTVLAADLTPENATPPHALLATEHALYFAADDGVHGLELWRLGSVSAPVPPAEAALSAAPVLGAINATYNFTATVAPSNATLPLTFQWQATGQAPVTHVVSDYTDSVAFSWPSAGTKELTLGVSNAAGTASATHSLLIVEGTIVALTPGVARSLHIVEAGLTTEIYIPSGAVSEPLALVYRSIDEVDESDSLLFAGRAFELLLYRNGIRLPEFEFAQPLQMVVPYRQQDVTAIYESELKLYVGHGNTWSDTSATCNPVAEQEVATEANTVSATTCKNGLFALFGPPSTRVLFLPFVSR